MLAPLIPVAAAGLDYLAGSGDHVGYLLGMALVAACAYAPGKYFQYQPRGTNRRLTPPASRAD